MNYIVTQRQCRRAHAYSVRARASRTRGIGRSSRQHAATSTLQACAPRNWLLRVFVLVSAVSFALPILAGDVRISFLPPPLEGTLSVGIYNRDGKLVRVLHREAELSDFEVAPDALRTTWDGKNDAGEQVPAGKYSARGFVVGDLHVEQIPAPTAAPNKISVRLIANPLTGGKRESVQLAAGFDDDGSFLQTADGLPLFTVDEAEYLVSVSLAQRGDKSLELCQNDGDSTDCFTVSGIEQMMAFDAGDFELK